MTKQQVLEAARGLSRRDQVELLGDLLDDPGLDGLPVSPALAAELDRRVVEDEACATPAEPVEVLVDRILRGSY